VGRMDRMAIYNYLCASHTIMMVRTRRATSQQSLGSAEHPHNNQSIINWDGCVSEERQNKSKDEKKMHKQTNHIYGFGLNVDGFTLKAIE
jgi:late competence protein required for DNA uptake (superfamily II DNA/RNA helicase)